MPAEPKSAYAERLFEHGQDGDLLVFAAENWPRPGLPLTADDAELARFARIAAYRQSKSSREASMSVVDLWQARAIEAASAAGAFRSAALSLQPQFYALCTALNFNEARAILDEILRLIESQKQPGPPAENTARRIHAERMAFSFIEEGRWGDALVWYTAAASYCLAGSRAALKVEGGRARAAWLAGGSAISAWSTFDVVRTASSEYPDVQRAAEANLAAAREDDPTRSVPFDLA